MKPAGALLIALGLVATLVTHGVAQTGDVVLLLPGGELHQRDLPSDPRGSWWVLHGETTTTVLERLEVAIGVHAACGESGERSGRSVDVPRTRSAIMLLRGATDLTAGAVPSVFVDDGVAGEVRLLSLRWNGVPVVVTHESLEPSGGAPGRYEIGLRLGDRVFVLHTDQWHGDGQWRVRWMGDLNRDGWPDLLADASYKYSVNTSRLFLSKATEDGPSYDQRATFSRSAC